MLLKQNPFLARALVLFLAGASNSAADAAIVRLRTVSATGNHVIHSPSSITVEQGATVTFHAQITAWGPGLLQSYQLQVESAGYTSGSAGSLSPVGWPGTPSTGAYIAIGRDDYVFEGVPSSPSMNTATLDYRFLSNVSVGNSQAVDATTTYAGTLMLQVSGDALGTFSVRFDPDAGDTVLLNQSGNPITRTTPFTTITVLGPGSGCAGQPVGTPCGDPDDLDCTDPNTCSGAGLCQSNHPPNGTPCTDQFGCAAGDTCQGGICGGDLPPGHFPAIFNEFSISDSASGIVFADDFSPSATGNITDIQWWGNYVEHGGNDCDATDDFTVAIYNDSSGRPGTIVSSQSISPTRCDTLFQEPNPSRTVFKYTGQLEVPISVTMGNCYWIEISNDTGVTSPECMWIWQRAEQSNSYSIRSPSGAPSDFDMAFKLNLPTTPSDCGAPTGTCCTCHDFACLAAQTLSDCSIGRWQLEDCTPSPCDAYANDACGSALPLTELITPFRNTCAGTDGFSPIPAESGPIGVDGDLWYTITTGDDAMPNVTLDTCLGGFDTVIALYSNGTGSCTCPLTAPENAAQLIEASDEGCLGFAGGGGATITATLAANRCYLVRVAGYDDNFGASVLRVSQLPPLPIIYVNRLATGADNGTSWANAYRYLQDALADASASGGAVDEIWVAQDIYKPDRGGGNTPGDRAATFQLINGVALYGGFNGTETLLSQRNPAINETILSGDLLGDDTSPTSNCCSGHASPGCDVVACENLICSGDGLCCSDDWDDYCAAKANAQCGICFLGIGENSYHVVLANVVDSSAVIDGFTITRGNTTGAANSSGGGMLINAGGAGGPTVQNCLVRSNFAAGPGGGLALISNDAPVITNCTFEDNFSAGSGGGILNDSSVLEITECTFRNNTAGGHAGALFGNANLRNCALTENVAVGGGGAIFYGGSDRSITDCVFSKNTAGNGGAIYLYQSQTLSLVNSVFAGNISRSSASGGSGGAVYIAGFNGTETLDAVNCSFSGNAAPGGGGAIYNSAHAILTQCTISGNSAGTVSTGGGVFNFAGTFFEATNSIFWNNSDANGSIESSQIRDAGATSINVEFNVIQGLSTFSGSGNIGGDPLLFDPGGADNVVGTIDDNLRMRAGSPAINSGDNASVPADTLDLDGDLNVAEPIPFDLAGNARFIGTVDMGTYEYFPDCNNNGVEDSIDISMASQDCDWGGGANGIPDECDIADCPARDCTGGPNSGRNCSVNAECPDSVCGNPAAAACHDCNGNGIPDRCDIGATTSDDVNADGVPDECAPFTGDCSPPTNEWSCFDNWDIPGEVYPNNVSATTYSVVLNGESDKVCLDVNVTIDTLDISNGATLQVTQPDPACGAMRFPNGPATSIDVVKTGGIVVEGFLTVAADNQINVTNGPFTIGSDGVYEADPLAAGPVSATMNALETRIIGGDCFIPPCPHGGEVNLSDAMALTTQANLVVDGSLANGECHLQRGRESDDAQAVLSFHVPPSIRVIHNSVVDIGSNVILSGAAGFLHESTQPMTIGGDWQNESVRPDCFDAATGIIRMDGTNPQTFEVAAADTGGIPAPLVAGISYPPFFIDRLEVADSAEVILVDAFDNDLLGQSSCGEAQYVGTLVLEANSAVTVQNCRLYYDTLIQHPSATLTRVGCGEARQSQNPSAVTADPTGLNKARAISFVPPAAAQTNSKGPNSKFKNGREGQADEASNSSNFELRTLTFGGSAAAAIRVTLVSLHHVNPPYSGGPSIPFTSFEGQVRWVGAPTQYMESSGGSPFHASQLQCAPHYRDWSTVGLLHVFGSAITPSSSYRVQVFAKSCDGMEDRCTAISAPLTIATTRWGDVRSLYNPPDPSIQPDISDVSALVDKFRNAPGAPIKARGVLAGQPGNAFGEVTPDVLGVDFGFSHISACVDAYRGVPYPYTMAGCP